MTSVKGEKTMSKRNQKLLSSPVSSEAHEKEFRSRTNMKANRSATRMSSVERRVVAVECLMLDSIQYLDRTDAIMRAIYVYLEAAFKERDIEINLLLRAALHERNSIPKKRTTKHLVRTLTRRLEKAARDTQRNSTAGRVQSVKPLLGGSLDAR
jgi:hypothetical protein